MRSVTARSAGVRGTLTFSGAENWDCPGALHEHDQVSGDVTRQVRTVVTLDEAECKVDTGGDTRGGEDVAILDEEGIGLDVDVGVGTREQLGVTPVSGRAVSRKQACGCEYERAGANGNKPARAGAQQPDGLCQV